MAPGDVLPGSRAKPSFLAIIHNTIEKVRPHVAKVVCFIEPFEAPSGPPRKRQHYRGFRHGPRQMPRGSATFFFEVLGLPAVGPSFVASADICVVFWGNLFCDSQHYREVEASDRRKHVLCRRRGGPLFLERQHYRGCWAGPRQMPTGSGIVFSSCSSCARYGYLLWQVPIFMWH